MYQNLYGDIHSLDKLKSTIYMFCHKCTKICTASCFVLLREPPLNFPAKETRSQWTYLKHKGQPIDWPFKEVLDFYDVFHKVCTRRPFNHDLSFILLSLTLKREESFKQRACFRAYSAYSFDALSYKV